MNNERLVAAIQWLVKEIIDNNSNPTLIETTVNGLLEEGFDLEEIDAAFELLFSLPELIRNKERLSVNLRNPKALRVFTPEEKIKITSGGQNWLISLANHGLISRDEFEDILYNSITFDQKVGLPELKWIITQVLEDEARAFLLITPPLGNN